LKMREHLPLLRKAGLWALWLGVEDISGELVKKGQVGDRTVEAFHLLRRNGIFPVPMLMHHDSQPLCTWRSDRGLLNQLGRLRRAGALYMQVLMLTPSPGSQSYDEYFTTGLAYQSVDGVAVEPVLTSGMHVIASRHPRPWTRQLNLLAGYAFFFNPLRFLAALVFSKSRIPLADAETWSPLATEGSTVRRSKFTRRLKRKLAAHFGDAALQAFGMWGLMITLRRTLGWAFRLARGRIQCYTSVPTSRIPMRAAGGGPAAHALAGTPFSGLPETVAQPPRENQDGELAGR